MRLDPELFDSEAADIDLKPVSIDMEVTGRFVAVVLAVKTEFTPDWHWSKEFY